jgi:type-F conjugative transfer system pilin assembly protein TrbC
MKSILLLVLSLFSYSSFAEKCNKCGIDNKFIESLSNAYTPNLELQKELPIKAHSEANFKDGVIKQAVKPTLIVFISSSIPRESLKNYTLEAKNYNNIVFLMRGLVNSSFISTKDFVLSVDGIIQIQEDAFVNYNISVVPTIVLAKEDENGKVIFDKVSGNISIFAALEIFSYSGDMSNEAKNILAKANEKGQD